MGIVCGKALQVADGRRYPVSVDEILEHPSQGYRIARSDFYLPYLELIGAAQLQAPLLTK
ncbi:hypothetical protein BH18GEM1_BH18GEM1_18470 [soil metagenome]